MRPWTDRPLLPRPRLIQRLQGCLAGRATFLVAPAGYGKTSLLSQLTEALEVVAVWCVVGANDADPNRFALRVLQAIQDELHNGDAAVIDSSAPSPHQLIRAGLEDLAAASSYCLLILDDFHNAALCDEVSDLLSRLLEELPSEIHLIISTRMQPEVPQLSKLQAQGRASIIDSNELAFTYDEVAAFLRFVLGSSFRSEDAQELFRLTRGWPACVSLLGASGLPYWAISGGGPAVYGYFAAEILRAMPAPTARFMLETSVLPSLTDDYCNELLKRADSASLLQQLSARSLVQPQPGRRSAYEYHPLMREFLSSRLRSELPARYLQLSLEASQVLEHRGQLEHSIDLLADLEAWRELAQLLERVAGNLLRRGMWNRLAAWIDRLPEVVLLKRPSLVLFRSKLAYLMGDAETALRLLSPSEEVQSSPRALTIKAAVLAFQGQPAEAVKVGKKALDLAGVGSAADPDVAAEACLYLGVAQIMRGSYVSAERSLRRALRRFLSTGDTYSQAVAYNQLAGIYHFRGSVEAEISLLEKAEVLWRKLGNMEQLARALNNLGVSHHQNGHHESALRAFSECLRLSRQYGSSTLQAYCFIGLGDLLKDQLKLKEAEASYAKGIAKARELGEGSLYAHALTGAADLRRLRGELEEAEAIGGQALVEARECGSPREEAIALEVLGSIYRDQGRVALSIRTLKQADEILSSIGSDVEAARAKFLLASALFRARLRSEALERLKDVAAIVERVGHGRFVLPLAIGEAALLQYAWAKRRGQAALSSWLPHLPGRSRPRRTGADSNFLPVELDALGGFTVRLDGTPVSDVAWETTKAKEMLLFLSARGGPVLKDEIVEALWPGLPAAKCNSYFHANLHRVRLALYPECVIRDGPRYALNPNGQFRSDFLDFQALIRRCQDSEAPARTLVRTLKRAVALYRGSFAPEVYSDWASSLRSELEDKYLWALGRLLGETLGSGHRDEVLRLCERVLEADPYHEAAWEELIRCHREAGHLSLSLRLYRRCTDVFLQELGVEVPPQIVELMRSA